MARKAVVSERALDPGRFKKLPEPIRLEDTVTTVDTLPAFAAKEGPWNDIEWMLRTAGVV